MSCAADGSDHRSCCRRRGVPTDCTRWCAGLKVTRANLCSLSAAQDIVSCFEEGKALLPGPPSQVHVKRFEDSGRVVVAWDPPEKNAGMCWAWIQFPVCNHLFLLSELVQWYRVFWRPVGSRDLNRNQTERPFFELNGLDTTKMYEFVVKAGNHHGLSLFTDPLVIPMSSYRSGKVGSQVLKILVSVSGVAMILMAVGAALVYGYRHQYFTRFNGLLSRSASMLRSSSSLSSPSSMPSRGVSFENPSYMKDGPVVQFSPPSNVEVNANYEPKHLHELRSPTS